jgi:hypothetical protein
MTHTLHRVGTHENLKNDYVVFAMSAKGHNELGSAQKMQEFFRITRRHNPVNMGDMKTGNILTLDPEVILDKIQDTSIVHAVYTDLDSVAAVLRDLMEADLGLSIVVSGLNDPVGHTCRKLGLSPSPHTIEYSLGIWGKVDLLPPADVLEVSTMCGHGQVAFRLIEKAAADIKAGRTTPAFAAERLAETCVCGVFNPARAADLLRKMAQG